MLTFAALVACTGVHPYFIHPDAPSAEFLDQYFAGECTAAEAEAIRAWAEQYPDTQAALDLLRQMRRSSTPRTWKVEEGWAEIERRIETQGGQKPDSWVRPSGLECRGMRLLGRRAFGRQSLLSTLWPPLIGAAIAIVGLAVAWRPGVFRGGERTHAVSTYVTGNGQRANIVLTDGSTVALGVASRLEVPADYSAGNHTLRLRGEALFTVVHQSNVPFTVIAGGEATRVLGTSFVVRHYAGDTTTTVAVRDGKVMVHSVILTAARQATIDRRGGVYVRSVDPALFSFASGVLTLNSLSLPDAIPALDRWYDVDIRLGDSTLVTKRITGDLPVGSVADLIALLQVEMHVVRNGQILTLFPK